MFCGSTVLSLFSKEHSESLSQQQKNGVSLAGAGTLTPFRRSKEKGEQLGQGGDDILVSGTHAFICSYIGVASKKRSCC